MIFRGLQRALDGPGLGQGSIDFRIFLSSSLSGNGADH
jgi:hypothetical protein